MIWYCLVQVCLTPVSDFAGIRHWYQTVVKFMYYRHTPYEYNGGLNVNRMLPYIFTPRGNFMYSIIHKNKNSMR